MTDQIVVLSALPFIGKRFFATTSYSIDNIIGPEQLTEAYAWVRKAVDQGFAPAKEAEKLFIGKVPMPNQGGPANRSQPIRTQTNSTSPGAGSGR